MAASQSNGASIAASAQPSSAFKEKEALPQLGALEEDDEFEEFAAEDWDPSESDLSHLVRGGKVTGPEKPGDKKSTNDTLWQDNWDDDDIEDDFSKRLREAIHKETAMVTA